MPMTQPSLWKKSKNIVRRSLGPSLSGTLQRTYERISVRLNRVARIARGSNGKPREFPEPTRYLAPGRQTWFGYYDVTPFDQECGRLLAMAGPKVTRTPALGERIEVGIFDVERPQQFRVLGSIETWCWQQGCRLRWLKSENRESVLYNKIVHGVPGAVLLDPDNGQLMREFNTPFYDVDRAGTAALTLNFARLQRLRPGYGYVLSDEPSANNPAPDDDGVWLFNLNSEQKTLLVSLATLAASWEGNEQRGMEHYVNHLQFNPGGDQFVFLHIATLRGARRTRLMVMRLADGALKILEKDLVASHFTWVNNRRLLVTVSVGDGRCEYRTYDTETGMKSRFGGDGLDRDGHPSVAPDGHIMLTDTYPDSCGDQELLLFAEAGCKKIQLGRFYSPTKFRGEWRCDLHPRFSPDGRQIAFDATPEGWRALYAMQVPQSG